MPGTFGEHGGWSNAERWWSKSANAAQLDHPDRTAHLELEACDGLGSAEIQPRVLACPMQAAGDGVTVAYSAADSQHRAEGIEVTKENGALLARHGESAAGSTDRARAGVEESFAGLRPTV